MPTLVPALGIEQVIATIADAPQAQQRRILSTCERIPVRAQMIPAMYDLLRGRVSITQQRMTIPEAAVLTLQAAAVGQGGEIFGKIAGVPASELDAALASLRGLAASGSSDEIRAFLGAFLPEAQMNGGAGPPSA